MKFSIIIPVYNVEKYLQECLDSVINQSFQDIEVVCVNDGSSYNSLSILEVFSQKDKRIKIFSQKNSGVSVAGNLGINDAGGDYIMFLDADDFYGLDLCRKVVAEIDINN